ncbi:hypothetical protein DACRYDRAFT_96400 [Dacryopinax primogenitus]|uniref:Uncharacterized protein n=1 Tax=Dacryopinax primogenitus (strain DJM 731) TaxID=1858805 RepID=M5FS50_DACPD|nr:uncharacterized protein DACRYDRAFT_96400 [Dacryopinax primogenitus]EJT98618.1 hypothetical protein DACRYDRAFT_96400 [Dacryopinax primogenitus]
MSSLPTASKDVSDQPGKNAVTDPVMRERMQMDVDRKMRFYGIIEAFRNGKMPDNQQIDETLRYVESQSPIDESQLSGEGRRLIADTRDIIETARLIVKEKNADELFQNFVFHTAYVDPGRSKIEGDVLPVDTQTVKADGQQALVHLRTLLTLFLTNSEFRKLLNDVGLIGRDMFATGAAKIAEAARPDAERMAQVDDAAPADQWQGANGKVHGPNETPALQVNLPGGRSIIQHPKEDFGAGATVRDKDGKEMSGAEAANKVQAKKDELVERGTQEAQDVQREVNGNTTADDTSAQAGVAKRSLKDKLLGLKDKIPQEHKDRVDEHKDNVKHFFEENFPEERRDQFIWRMKKVVVECQKHDDYQGAMNWFLNFLETYHAHGKALAETGVRSAGHVAEDPALKQAVLELRTLLERFANNTSLDGIINATQDLYNDAQNDPALRAWFEKLDAFVRRTLLQPAYVLQPQYNEEGRALLDEGKGFFDVKYRAHKDNLFDQIEAWFVAFGEDRLNKRFGEDWSRLTKDILFDDEGNLAFKPHLWNDIRHVILPQIIDQVGYIPIPRVEYTDPTVDLVIENLTLQGANILPNIIEVEAQNYVKFSPYSTIPDVHHHELILTLGQMQADMRDVAFCFKKKSGFPRLSDHGLADVMLGGTGLTATVHIASASKDSSSVFHVQNVNVKIDTLKFAIRDSKHDTLYKILRPLATGLIKKQIQKAIQDAIRTGLEYVDGQLVTVRDRMNEAKAQDGVSRTDVLKEIFQRKKEEAQSVKERKSEFKIDTSRNSMLLPDVGYEKGWIQKVSDRKDAAAAGEGWHSPAFSIINPNATLKSHKV